MSCEAKQQQQNKNKKNKQSKKYKKEFFEKCNETRDMMRNIIEKALDIQLDFQENCMKIKRNYYKFKTRHFFFGNKVPEESAYYVCVATITFPSVCKI